MADEILLNQYEDGLIKLEEVVNIDPRNPSERYSSDSDKDSPVVNKKKKSPNKKKRSQKGKHKKEGVDTKKIKVEQLDCVECVRQVNQPEEAEAPDSFMKFIQDVGVPWNLVSDMAKAETKGR